MGDGPVQLEHLDDTIDVKPSLAWCSYEAREHWSERLYSIVAACKTSHTNPIPPCCSAVQYSWPGGLLQAAEQTTGITRSSANHLHILGSPYTNIVLNPMGLTLIAHQPCNLACRPSRDIGKSHHANVPVELSRDLLALLEMPVRWDALKGIGILHTPLFKYTFSTTPFFPRVLVDHEVSAPMAYDGFFDRGAVSGTTFPNNRIPVQKRHPHLLMPE